MSPQQGRSGYHKGVSERIPTNVAEKLREIVAQHNELSVQLLDSDVLIDHRKVTALSIKKALISLPKGVTEIKTDEVVAMVEKGPKAGNYFLVDARPAKIASAGHIPTAVSIPVNVLKKKGSELLPVDKNTMLVFYCGGPT